MVGAALLTSALVLALAVQLSAAQTPDCTAKYGPGCLRCEEITVSRPTSGYQGHVEHRRSYGGRQWDDSWREQGRRGLKHRGGENSWGRPWGPSPSQNDTRLVCTACSMGYTLVSHRNNTYGSCQCATGFGVVPINSTDSGSSWESRRRGYSCVDCSLEGKVPLTDDANLKLSWDGSSWGLVLASSASANSISAQHAGGWGDGHWHRGWGAAGVRPPYYAGQCVACPEGSLPSADSSKCVAGAGSQLDPPPEASPSQPTPLPSPPPSDLGPCLVVTDDDVSTLQSDISANCALDGSASVPLDGFGWSDDPNMLNVWFSTDLDIMTDTGASTGMTEASCSKMSQLQGQAVTVTWLVNDAGITCSPSTGTFTLTIPTWDSSQGSTASEVDDLAALVPTASTAAATAATTRRRAVRRPSSSFRLVASKNQQPAAPVAKLVGELATQPSLATASVVSGAAAAPAAQTVTLSVTVPTAAVESAHVLPAAGNIQAGAANTAATPMNGVVTSAATPVAPDVMP